MPRKLVLADGTTINLPDTQTLTQARLAALAAILAAANPDAAAELARRLAWEAQRHKRPAGLGIVVRFDEVTGCLEMIVG